jgi:hypothetical protein
MLLRSLQRNPPTTYREEPYFGLKAGIVNRNNRRVRVVRDSAYARYTLVIYLRGHGGNGELNGCPIVGMPLGKWRSGVAFCTLSLTLNFNRSSGAPWPKVASSG